MGRFIVFAYECIAHFGASSQNSFYLYSDNVGNGPCAVPSYCINIIACKWFGIIRIILTVIIVLETL